MATADQADSKTLFDILSLRGVATSHSNTPVEGWNRREIHRNQVRNEYLKPVAPLKLS